MLARDALLDGEPLASVAALEAMRDHARAAYPEEAVGFLMSDGCYHPQENICPEPTRGARVDPNLLATVLSANTLRAYFHSHPNGPDCPSEQDMRSQIELDVPWIICSATDSASLPPFAWGDMLVDPSPLVGRPFRHGVTDCYAAIRAWWLAERGVLLPEVPRQWEWWLDGVDGDKDLYRRYFAGAGFHEIDASEVLPGDCWLAQVRASVPNHAGVYIGEGLTFHHPSSALASDPARLSKREPVARWQRHITHWLRRAEC
jgi:proteasome lid subunit RPN8/RPN11